MFYQFNHNSLLRSSPLPAPGALTIGYLSIRELENLGPSLELSPEMLKRLVRQEPHFRSGVEVYENLCFTQLSLLRLPQIDTGRDEVSILIRKDLILIASIVDADGSTERIFQEALSCFSPGKMTLERFLSAFLTRLVSQDVTYLEKVREAIARMERSILSDEFPADLNHTLFSLKSHLLILQNYYKQLLDFTEAISDNLTELFEEAGLVYIANSTRHIERRLDDASGLYSAAEHLEDALSAHMDLKMNRSMKVLTVLTTVLFPLTIISGWYGMNFQSQPEFGWKYGYVYAVCLALGSMILLYLIGRKKKWF